MKKAQQIKPEVVKPYQDVKPYAPVTGPKSSKLVKMMISLMGKQDSHKKKK